MKQWFGTGRRAMALAAVGLLAVMLCPGTARAASPGCSLSSHCYSILRGKGTAFYGMYGTWARSAMATSSSSSAKRFVDSEMWFPNKAETAWAETGLAAGWFNAVGTSGYYGFGAYMTTGGSYSEHSFGAKSQSSGTTDEYQISRGGATNKWNVYMDGALWSTPSLGFWQGPHPQGGGEVATAYGTASTFTMYFKAYNSAGTKVNFGSVTTAVDNPPLTGSSPANSTWKWKIS